MGKVGEYFSYVAYHWDNGAYISGVHYDFHKDLEGLIKQFGPPNKVKRTGPKGAVWHMEIN